jgi:nicotinamidase/pyrazinamidase
MEKLKPQAGDALLVVDVQNDFLPGGSLGVARGDEIVPLLNRCIALFVSKKLPVYASRDWHPPDHCSFQAQGGPWPVHCVADTPGAAFASNLELPPGVEIINKADTREREAYSVFSGTDLDRRLKAAGIKRLFIGGLATDYCVLNTAKDARALGYDYFVLTDAVRAVDIKPGDGERALEEMRKLGAQFATSAELAT